MQKGCSIALAVVMVFCACPVHAQWPVNDPTIPRAPDGTPVLTGNVPHQPDGRPDLAGIWIPDPPHVRDLEHLPGR
jgi:hypothetical protein